jgi:hypothetical protein
MPPLPGLIFRNNVNMKTISKISFILLLYMNPFICQSQSTKFQIGIEGGPSLTMLRDNGYNPFTSSNIDIGLGGSIGVAFQYNMNAKMGIGTNLSYERKGWQNKSGTFHQRFDYLILPVLFKVSFGKKSRTFIHTGPYFGYLISQSDKLDGDVTNTSENDYKKNDLGVTIGFGVNIPIANQLNMIFEIRNNLGLVDIEKSEDGKTYTNSTLVQLGFIYNFGNEMKK